MQDSDKEQDALNALKVHKLLNGESIDNVTVETAKAEAEKEASKPQTRANVTSQPPNPGQD